MRYLSIAIIAATVAVCSCEDDKELLPATGSDGICFGISGTVAWPDEPAGRAAELPADMGCYAFLNFQRVLFINNGIYRHDASTGVYSSATKFYWPGDHTTLDFYNYSPYNAPGLTFDATFGTPSFAYTMPDSPADRCDLLLAVAKDVPGDTDAALKMTFKHALTAVNIQLGRNMGKVQINKITFSGLHNSGRIITSEANELQWTFNDNENSSEYDFQYNITNYLIPQKLDGAVMTVDMVRDGKDVRLTTPLKTAAIPEWLPGQSVTYKLNIVPSFEFEPIAPLDAHYVICTTTLHVGKLTEGSEWRLTVSGGGSYGATVQHYTDANEFAKDGYWTDKYMSNHTPTPNSARGDKYITGSGNGDYDIMIFVPENNTGTDRTITLTITTDDNVQEMPVTHEIIQLGTKDGWEQIDDGESGEWGFTFNEQHVYIYNDTHTLGSTKFTNAWNATASLIAQYGVGELGDGQFVTMNYYYYPAGLAHRFYVCLDYRKLNALDTFARSANNGFGNTIDLFDLSGATVPYNFEMALKAMVRPDSPKEKAFRPRDNKEDRLNVPENVNWDDTGRAGCAPSQALTHILKKNRYYLNRYIDSATGSEKESPVLLGTDIMWYMPAVGQFVDFGEWPHSAAETWSSTTAGNGQTYTGDGNAHAQDAVYYIRARRR